MNWAPTILQNPFDTARVWKVVASAGCGKSFQIRKVIFDLLKSGVRIQEIMYLIYNKAPAEEFRNELINLGIKSEDMPWIGTHHSIACRLLGVNRGKILSGKKLKEWGVKHGFSFSEKNDDPENKNTFWDNVLTTLDLKIANEDYNFDPHERKLLEAFKASEYDDEYTHARYLEKTIKMGLVPPDVSYAFFDEGQDNNKLQFSYIDHLKAQESIKGILLAGDDKQAINIYRGGKPSLFLDFKADRYVCLGKTYRNTDKVLAFSNAIATPIAKRSPLTIETNRLDHGGVIFFDDLEDVVYEIEKDLRANKDVYMLSRLNKWKNKGIRTLREAGVPVSLKPIDRMRKIFKAMQVLAEPFTFQDLLAVLPKEDPISGDLNKTSYWKRGALKKFLAGDYSLDDEEAALRAEYELFCAGEITSKDFDLEDYGFSPKFMEDVMQVKENIVPKGVWRGMNDKDVDYFERMVRSYGVDSKAVWPSTIHGAKGAECDVVVLLTNINKATESTEMDDPDAERRVWYTAVTRAKEKVYICPVRAPRIISTRFV